MKPVKKTIIFLIISWGLVAGIFYFVLPLLVWYLIRNDSYELIILAILIDGYYQAFYSIPMISIGAVILVGSINLIKPHLMMYNAVNEAIS
jgi:hypothetical protein